MKKLAMIAGPTLATVLWNRRKRRGAQGVPAAVTAGDLDRPQDQTHAMEDAVEVPGGVRP